MPFIEPQRMPAVSLRILRNAGTLELVSAERVPDALFRLYEPPTNPDDMLIGFRYDIHPPSSRSGEQPPILIGMVQDPTSVVAEGPLADEHQRSGDSMGSADFPRKSASFRLLVPWVENATLVLHSPDMVRKYYPEQEDPMWPVATFRLPPVDIRDEKA